MTQNKEQRVTEGAESNVEEKEEEGEEEEEEGKGKENKVKKRYGAKKAWCQHQL